MREPVKKTIDGEQYTFYQMNPRKSLKLMTRILKLIGAPVGTAFGGHEKTKSVFDQDINIGVIVEKLCDRLDENEVEYIIDQLLSQVTVAGKGEISKVFDEHFAGRLPHLFKVVFACLEVEYGDFLAGLSGLTKSLGGRAGMTQGIPTSNGLSGDRS